MSTYSNLNITNNPGANLQVGDHNTMNITTNNISTEDKKILSYSNIESLIDERIESFKVIFNANRNNEDEKVQETVFQIKSILNEIKTEIQNEKIKESESTTKEKTDEFNKTSLEKKKTIIEKLIGMSKIIASAAEVMKSVSLLGPYFQGTASVCKPIWELVSGILNK